jgi:cell division protein FtsZ
MEKRGTALMGRGVASGDKRAIEAAEMAIKSPLLEDISISSAKGLLINITGPSTISMEEIDAACNFLRNQVNEDDVDIYWGVVIDDRIEDEIQVTVIATGIDGVEEEREEEKEEARPNQRGNVVNIKSKIRDATPEEIKEPWTVRRVGDYTAQSVKEELENSHENEKGKKRGLINKIKNLDYPAFLRNSDSKIKEKK